MILELTPQLRYYKWFAWCPVVLVGPDEWTRNSVYSTDSGRLVWLRFVWRFESYIALPWEGTTNKLLLDSVEGRETGLEKAQKERIERVKREAKRERENV